MTTPAATAHAVPVFDELSLIEQRAAHAKQGWMRLLCLAAFCFQVAVSTFAWRAYADAHAPPPAPPPMPDEVLGTSFHWELEVAGMSCVDAGDVVVCGPSASR